MSLRMYHSVLFFVCSFFFFFFFVLSLLAAENFILRLESKESKQLLPLTTAVICIRNRTS